ncbi:SusC/RagA family TonB-linked outer membrane protein [Niabella sp. CJ426]|uniref:SusC/RagA family TonB-linked outer membrane protein n=1 Tax=Niabella sp. CJ426 TaxID=3393740 RepID=UPI003CFEB93F
MKLLLAAVCSLLTLFAVAQGNITVTGIVKGKDTNLPISNVTVSVGKAETGITTTNEKGEFVITVAANAILTFSYTGYDKQKINLNGRDKLEVVLAVKDGGMEQVVVQGFQKRQKQFSTGSSVTISGKDIQDVPTSNVMELLQGRVAGVNIQNTTGMPGFSSSIFVRGVSNIGVSGGGNDAFLSPSSPLFVIDGVPYDPNTNFEYGFNQGGPGVSPVSLIPPEDIEEFSFLKDAMATSVYGSRGANGVIIITTKRGRSKKPIITYTGNFVLSVPPGLKTVLGGKDERDIRIKQILENDTTLYSGRDRIQENPFLADYLNPYYNNSTNWQSIFYRPKFNMTHNISAAGGDTKFNYKSNLSYYNERGIIENTGFSRYTMGLNTEYMPTDRFRLFTSITASLGNQSMGSGTGMMQGGVATAASASSLLPPPSFFSGNSTALGVSQTNNENKTGRLATNIDVRYELIKGLNLQNNLSYDFTTGRTNTFTPSSVNNNYSLRYSYDSRRQGINNRASLNYTTNFTEDHLITAFLFSEVSLDQFMAKVQQQSGTPNDQYEGPVGYISNFQKRGGILNSNYETRLFGYGGTFQYNYRKKYVLDFSYRLDGSSTNGPNQPFVKVPAVGLRWNFNKEKFMERLDWIDYSSLRASWGRNIVPTGSIFDAYGRYVTSGQYNNNPATGLNWEYLPNVGLLPRITTQLSYALEAGFLNGKFSTVLESYYKQLDNELFNIAIADHNGFAKFKTNYMSHVNYGYEFTVTYRPINKEKVRWNISANGAFNHDILTRLPNDVRQILHKDETTVGGIQQDILYRLGRNSVSNVLYHYRGVFPDDASVPVDPTTGLPYYTLDASGNKIFFKGGDPYWTDLDGNYILDERDLVVAGNAFPKFTGGFQSMLTYGAFTLTMNMSVTAGRDILNNSLAQRLASYNNPVASQSNAALVPINEYNFWQGQGDVNATYPNPYDFTRSTAIRPFRFNQTLFQEDGSYFKLNTVTVGYNVPKARTQRYGINYSRIYFTANNVYTFSNYSGPDPENVTDLGRDRADGYPTRRTYTIGLNLQF